ncbi:nuclear transport factor 2 family protein [Nocardia lijiangensis]|uniref:nuclear transport factor 2 family protein n=1 Tax=Nocardia lijiangensis TaxID=299618 RepID=UPI003D715C40
MARTNATTTTNDIRRNDDERAEFIDFFTTGLAKGNRDDFIDHFLPRIQPDVRYSQPLSRGGYGHAGFRRLFTGLFAAVPDLHGTVHRWSPTDDGVLIEFTLAGTLGRRPVAVNLVDRILLRDSLIASIDTYFDPTPLTPRMLAHPVRALRLLPRFFPSRIECAAIRSHDCKDQHTAPAALVNDDSGPTDAFNLMAVGRLILAVTSLAAPRQFAKIVGVTPSPELAYMTRIYGARALAMGLGYLTSGPEERRRWQRLSLAVDTSDTLTGLVHLLRRDVPLQAALSMTALTGSYAAFGAVGAAARR